MRKFFVYFLGGLALLLLGSVALVSLRPWKYPVGSCIRSHAPPVAWKVVGHDRLKGVYTLQWIDGPPESAPNPPEERTAWMRSDAEKVGESESVPCPPPSVWPSVKTLIEHKN